jgi:hypothetical protein
MISSHERKENIVHPLFFCQAQSRTSAATCRKARSRLRIRPASTV